MTGFIYDATSVTTWGHREVWSRPLLFGQRRLELSCAMPPAAACQPPHVGLSTQRWPRVLPRSASTTNTTNMSCTLLRTVSVPTLGSHSRVYIVHHTTWINRQQHNTCLCRASVDRLSRCRVWVPFSTGNTTSLAINHNERVYYIPWLL